MLRAKFFTPEQVAGLAGDYRAAGLDPVDEAIAAFAERAVLHADEMTQADVDALRAHGLGDAEILDIVLAATARIFWSRANDAIGYEPPAWWLERTRAAFGDELFAALTVGRPFDHSVDASSSAARPPPAGP